MADDQNQHGYHWHSDGKVHDVPEPPRTGPMTATEVQVRTAEHGKGRDVTQETLNKAYAAWLKEFTEWRKRMDAWEAKYGSKV